MLVNVSIVLLDQSSEREKPQHVHVPSWIDLADMM